MNPWLGIPGALILLYGLGAGLDGLVNSRGHDILVGAVVALAGCALLMFAGNQRQRG